MTTFLIIALVIAALGVVVGLARGTGKTLIRLITLILAAVVTFFVAIPIAELLATVKIKLAGSGIEGMESVSISEALIVLLNSNETTAGILGDNPLLEAAARRLPVMILSIVTFIAAFLLLCLISLIVYSILKSLLPKHDDQYGNRIKPGMGSRLGGALLGLVSAVLCIGVLLVPVLGTARMLADLPEDSKIAQKEEYYDPVVSSALVKAYDEAGFGKLGFEYMKKASKVTTETGYVLYLSDEVGTLARIYDLFVEYGIADEIASEGGFDSALLVESISDSVFTEKLMSLILDSKLLSEILGSASYNGGNYLAGLLGLPIDDADGYKSMTGMVASEISASSSELEEYEAYSRYLAGDYTTGYNESPVADGKEDYVSSEDTRFKIEGSDAEYVLKYEDGEPYIGVLYAGNVVLENYMPVKTVLQHVQDLADKITDKIVKSVSATGMDETQTQQFKESVGSTVSGMMTAAAAEMISGGTFSGESVRQYLNADGNADVKLQENAFKYGGITAKKFAEAFEESITELMNSDTEDSAKTFAAIISPAAQIAGAIMSIGENDAKYAYVAPAVGQMIGAMHGSEALNGLGLTVLEAMSNSSTLSDVLPEELTAEIIRAYTDENADVSQIATAVASSANIVAALSSGDADTVEKLIKDLVNSIDDGTEKLIDSLVTEEFMAKYIKNEAYARNAKEISSAVLGTLSGAKGRESYRNEAEALVYLYDLVVNNGGFGTDDFVALLRYAEQSDIIADIVHDCSGCRVNLSETRRAEFAEAMEDAMATSTVPKSVSAPVYNDVSAILGLGLTY